MHGGWRGLGYSLAAEIFQPASVPCFTRRRGYAQTGGMSVQQSLGPLRKVRPRNSAALDSAELPI
jgi:hypothetical protein